MMKIMIYVPGIPFDGEGGHCTHVRELARNLSKLRNKVTVVAPCYSNYTDNGIVIKSTSPFRNRLLDFITSPIFDIIVGISTIIRWRPDVLYLREDIHGWGHIVPKICKCPNVIEINGLDLIDEDEIKLFKRIRYKKTIKGILLEILRKYKYNIWMTKWAIQHGERFIAVTPRIKEIVQKRYNIIPEKIVVILNGVNINIFKPVNVQKARSELKMDNNNRYVSFIGSLFPWQGVEFLIQSAPLILKEMPNTKYLIVGEGQMKEELMDLAERIDVSDNFIFTGAVPYEDVPKYVNASDVCVVYKKPLKSGYSPLKLYEYMACGKPVVASKVEGFELLEEQNAGILAEPENPEELAKAIIKLLKDEKLREEMGKNGREYVVKNHSWESVARRVADVCEEAIREHKNKRR